MHDADEKQASAVQPNHKRKYFKWKAVTINVRTCSDDAELTHAVNVYAGLGICCLKEVRRHKADSLIIGEYACFWTGMMGDKRNGVGIAVTIYSV